MIFGIGSCWMGQPISFRFSNHQKPNRMSQIKGKCIMVAQEKGHITETLRKGVEYQFSKSFVEKIKQHGYTIINPADPANPIRMKEETFNLYFQEVDPNALAEAKKEPAQQAAPEVKQEPAAEQEQPVSRPSIKPATTATPKTVAVAEHPKPMFIGMESLIDNMDMIESITFTPQKDNNLMVTVKVKPDLDFSVTGVPEKIMEDFPVMLKELFSIKAKVNTLNELIERRIELERQKELEAKKEKAAPAAKKSTATAAKKEEPKKEEPKKGTDKENTLFDQKNEKPTVESSEPEPLDQGGDGIDANDEEDWG